MENAHLANDIFCTTIYSDLVGHRNPLSLPVYRPLLSSRQSRDGTFSPCQGGEKEGVSDPKGSFGKDLRLRSLLPAEKKATAYKRGRKGLCKEEFHRGTRRNYPKDPAERSCTEWCPRKRDLRLAPWHKSTEGSVSGKIPSPRSGIPTYNRCF